ncbi:protein pitchfork isoform X1 [Clupea harengus]|uniref:Protein pitchfork isoform X1 n=1 Tax=Clupea harengus TaxID=7950 RepID=A0A6P8F2R4_CLUHA|nr:protein pitchfork isoform X1 [Clupea harengus]
MKLTPPGYYGYHFVNRQVGMAATREAAPRVAFGSCRQRALFPTDCPPNRLGNEMRAMKGSPELGPGCYDNHVIGTVLYDIQKRPESKKGYVLAARTTARFRPPAQTVTPSPQKYQPNWALSKTEPPGKTPFNSTTSRLTVKNIGANLSPGPGTYAHDTAAGRKVCWPMKFGSPDWSSLPQLKRKALRTQLQCDKEFVKQRSRVVYLQLYYS